MDPNINVETGESTSTRSVRFPQWVAFLVFSTITMGSAIQVKNNAVSVTSSNRYAVACSVVTFILTVVVVVAQLFPVTSIMFVGTKIEGVLTIVLVVFWAAIVSIGTDAGDSLGCTENASNEVQSANLYYFSWAGFVTAVIILVSFLRDVLGFDLSTEVRNRAARLQWWAALLAVSIVVTGSSSQVITRDCQFDSAGNFSDAYCRKTRLAIAAGALGTIFSLLTIAAKVIQYTATESMTPFLVEIGSAIFLTILSIFNVAFATSADAPGSGIGNLYYFSWAMFLVSTAIASECYGAFLNPPAVGVGDKQNGSGEVEIETFDESIY